VVGAVLPWNSPILLYSGRWARLWAAGNAMVLKPAEQTPVTAIEIAKLVEEAGFRPGVFNVVPALGTNRWGPALAAHRARQSRFPSPAAYRRPRAPTIIASSRPAQF